MVAGGMERRNALASRALAISYRSQFLADERGTHAPGREASFAPDRPRPSSPPHASAEGATEDRGVAAFRQPRQGAMMLTLHQSPLPGLPRSGGCRRSPGLAPGATSRRPCRGCEPEANGARRAGNGLVRRRCRSRGAPIRGRTHLRHLRIPQTAFVTGRAQSSVRVQMGLSTVIGSWDVSTICALKSLEHFRLSTCWSQKSTLMRPA